MPSYSLFGWQKPCYLLGEGYAKSYAGASRHDRVVTIRPEERQPKCEDCMVHSGYEATAAADMMAPHNIIGSIRSVFAK